MARPRMESLEVRKLFAAVTPDLSFGVNGTVQPPPDGPTNKDTTLTYLGRSGDGFLISRFTYERERRVESLEKITAGGTRDRSYAAPLLTDTVGQFVYTDEAVDPQGRALIVRSGGDSLTLTRYRANGTVDTAFAEQGRVSLPLPRPTGGVYDGFAGTYAEQVRIAVAGDGSFYLGAEVYGFNRKTQRYSSDGERLVLRFTADGRRDAAFGGTQGYLRLGNLDTDYFAATPDGGVLVGHRTKLTRYVLAKYDASGTADAGFGTGGVVRLARDDNAGAFYLSSFGVTQDAGGRILVARSAPTPALLRLTAAGRFDGTFGTGGADDQYLQRLNTDGSPDTSLDGDGRADLRFGNGRNILIDRLPDGNYLTALATTEYSRGQNVQKLSAFSGVRLSTVGQLFIAETTRDTADRITVTRTTGGGTRVTANGQTTDFAAGAVKSIYADLGDGDNAFDSSAIAVPTTLIGGLGSDTLRTGDGDDTVQGYNLSTDYNADDSAARDVISTAGGVDFIVVGRAAYDIDSGAGGGRITNTFNNDNRNRGGGVGGRGNWDIALFARDVSVTLAGKSQRGVSVTADTATVDLGGFFGDVKVEFFGASARIVTGTGNDVIATGDGDDRVSGDNDYTNTGGTGLDDSVDLGTGNDLLVDRTGDNTVTGGDGDDTITTGNGRDRVGGGVGRDLIRGGGGRDTLSGEGSNDTLYGDAGNDYLFGGRGDDRLLGGAGDDFIYGNVGRDRLYGEAGGDQLFANTAGRFADPSANLLDGGLGRDRAYRESDDDVLVGVESTFF